ncbi:hypothetical protein NKG05_00360 [Oerskovia sp. M15]
MRYRLRPSIAAAGPRPGADEQGRRVRARPRCPAAGRTEHGRGVATHHGSLGARRARFGEFARSANGARTSSSDDSILRDYVTGDDPGVCTGLPRRVAASSW